MTQEVKIVSIFFDVKPFSSEKEATCIDSETVVAELLNDGWQIVAAFGAASRAAIGFAVLQREAQLAAPDEPETVDNGD